MKWLTTNRFFRILKRFILLLPFTFVLVSSLYVVFNPNAKDSYYGDVINDYELETLTSYTELNTGYRYRFIYNGAPTGTPTGTFTFTNVTNVNSTLGSNVTSNMFNIRFYSDTGYKIDISYLNSGGTTSHAYVLLDDTVRLVFDFELVSYSARFVNTIQYFNSIIYAPNTFLSNAFEVAMYEFNNIGFGKIDLVTWFSSLFANDVNNVYIQFVNSYFNYFIFVECVAILPMFFHWIIHLFEDAVDYMKIGNKRRKGNDDD